MERKFFDFLHVDLALTCLVAATQVLLMLREEGGKRWLMVERVVAQALQLGSVFELLQVIPSGLVRPAKYKNRELMIIEDFFCELNKSNMQDRN